METVARNDHIRDAILSRLQQLEAGRFSRDLTFPGSLTSVERRRITEYTGGITRSRRWLDFVIDHWARNPSRIQPPIRQALRIGAYELIVLDRPPHAVLNASVEQARRQVKGQSSAGFVNAVLRQIQRNRDSLPEPNTGNQSNDLAIRYSHPTWMVERWTKQFGLDATINLLTWNNARPSFGIRINPILSSPAQFTEKLDKMEIDWRPSRFLDDYILVDTLQSLVASGLIQDGEFGVQDESAGLVVEMMAPQPGEFMIDACAAPGGKMIRAATLMNNTGRVIAVDPNSERLSLAAEAAKRHGLSNVEYYTGSFLEFELPTSDRPDRILLDVPCSGLGVLARRPDLRWRDGLEDTRQLTRLQDQLLDKAADSLNVGGVITYATCTIEPAENCKRIEAFLRRHRDFRVVPTTGAVPAEMVDSSGFFAAFPHTHHIDGAFAAQLRKVK